MNMVNHSSKTTTTAKPILRILAILGILVQTIALSACGDGGGGGEGESWKIANYDGNGSIAIELSDPSDCRANCLPDISLNAGSVENGLIKLDLPAIPNEYLVEAEYEDGDDCSFSPKDVRITEAKIFLSNNSGENIGELINIYFNAITYERQGFYYMYFSKAAKQNCYNDEGGYNGSIYKSNIDAKAGWNKIYFVVVDTDEYYSESSTSNILTKSAEWFLLENGRW